MTKSNDNKTPQAVKTDERNSVELPFLEQLKDMGWQVLDLAMSAAPAQSQRTDFREVVLKPELTKALKTINPFLEDDQIEELAARMTNLPNRSLIENNKAVFEMLTTNPSVPVNRQTGEVSPTVQYIDFKTPANNRFLAVSQFKVAIPGTDNHIIPDIVLFVNGLPLVVIECKSPTANDPVASAIDQLQRYSEQRGASGEGNPALFWHNLFTVVTCRTEAKFGTITTEIEKHFYRWSDPYPTTLDKLPSSGQTGPNNQQRLVAGMCRHENLLSLLQSYTTFAVSDKGKILKIVGRYQQFRAVKKAITLLRSGNTPRERSGIIWHTQGSGKSLTMMFLVRELRQLIDFAGWKIVFITDRKDLEDQLTATAQSIGQTVKVANNIAKLKDLLRERAADIVIAMIHKFQEHEMKQVFPLLNDSAQILTMTDEAHRSQYGLLGANFDQAIPNAARIAYTGTPIEKTEKTFGDYIDKYTMRESIADGTTLAIVYEGRTHTAHVSDAARADAAFEDVFSENNVLQRLQVLGYGSRQAYLEATSTIQAKARDMVDHYVANVFLNGYKGQVVATSREAAAAYKRHLDAAVAEKAAALSAANGQLRTEGGTITVTPEQIERLRTMETAVVISGGDHNEKPHLKAFTNEHEHKRAIKRFKLSFGAKTDDGEETVDGNVGLMIVNNMLLTGFDAPVEQVLYLDQVIRDHNLLQTIARVNRVADENKLVGYVVDYVGVGNDLKAALEAYAQKELDEVLEELSDPDEELGKLKEANQEVHDLLRQHRLTDLTDIDAFYDAFYDEDVRFAYILAFKKLTQALNIVLPRKEALMFIGDYQKFVEINHLASQHFRDGRMSMKGVPPKLRAITDAYLESQGIDVKIEPISILDENFQKDVEAKPRSKTKAATVEHALRHHLEIMDPDDPELAASFAAELSEILRQFSDNWDRIYEELEKLRDRIKAKEREQTYGLDRRKQMPVFRIFKKEIFQDAAPTEDQIAALVNLTQLATMILTRELSVVGFWQSAPAQAKLKAELQDLFLKEPIDGLPNLFPVRAALITRTMEWAKSGALTR